MGGGGGGGGRKEGKAGSGGEGGFEVLFFAFKGDLPPGVEDGVGGFLKDLFCCCWLVVGGCGGEGRGRKECECI